MPPLKMRRAASAKAAPNRKFNFSAETISTGPLSRQALRLKTAFHLPPATARVVAELAFGGAVPQ
ncbi:hypothetical protein ABIB90_000519 [Bradyrhizobium sp. JR4.1]